MWDTCDVLFSGDDVFVTGQFVNAAELSHGAPGGKAVVRNQGAEGIGAPFVAGILAEARNARRTSR